MSELVGSEEDFIARFLQPLAAGLPGAFGLLDDAAVVACAEGDELVVSTDAVAEGVHFFPGDPPGDIAFKALAANVSDLIVKGAVPSVYLMSLALPARPQTEWMTGFVSGLRDAQDKFSITLTGGDTDRRPGPLTVSITAIGHVPKGRMVRRSGAQAGHQVFLSGRPGLASLGLALRQDPALAEAWGITADETQELLTAYARPVPPVALRQTLLDHASASIDVSDGLAKDLLRLCTASGVGATLDCRLLDLSAGVSKIIEREPHRLADVLSGGEDYLALAAVAPGKAALFRSEAAAAGVMATQIGGFNARPGLAILGLDGRSMDLARLGWDHLVPE